LRAARKTGEGGFTLVELLISVTLLGLLMVVVMGGLRFGVRAWERNDSHSSGSDQVRLVQSLLRSEIERIYPFFIYDQAHVADRHVDFEGTPDGMSFLAPAPASLDPHGGQARVMLAADTATGALTLSMRPELAQSAQVYDETLLSGLKSVEFSYFGSDDPQDAPSWQDHWTHKMRLPQLIRIHAVFRNGDARVWPEFVAAPHIAVDVACVYDALTKYCQGRQ